MSGAVIRSYAKVNLFLQVHGRRADGFHELSSVLHEIALHDEIRISPEVSASLSCDRPDVPTDGRNLVLKALALLGERLPGVGPKRISIIKRIPPGGGLAGGSSNAMYAMMHVAAGLSVPEGQRDAAMRGVAEAVGSDTSFFLRGRTALCTGRGEMVEPLPHRRLFFNLVLPPFPCETKAVFGAFGETRAGVAAELPGWLRDWRSGAFPAPRNDLENACVAAYPEMGEIIASGRKKGLPLHLSGSGSTLFTVHAESGERDDRAEEVESWLPPYCRLIRTESRT